MHLPTALFLSLLLTLTKATNHDITVGPALSFTPNITHASPSDTLTFHFYPGRHNVAQSPFSTPCVPAPNGFYSGFIVPDSGEANTTFVVMVNDTQPIWFYCSEFMHCQLGMVGVVNPPATGDSLAAYAAAAAKTSNSTTPAAVAGGVFSVNGSSGSASTTSTPSGTESRTSTSMSSTGTTSPTASLSEGVVLFGSGGNVLLNGIAALVAVAAVWAGLI